VRLGAGLTGAGPTFSDPLPNTHISSGAEAILPFPTSSTKLTHPWSMQEGEDPDGRK
jgi:hypothetical protein